jgi:uncharacterized protein (DUF983 family)
MCPRCGRGRLLCGFLMVADHCTVCYLNFIGHHTDPGPVILWIETGYAPLFQLAVYLPVTVLVLIALLQLVEDAVMALQWSFKIHSVDANLPDELQT